MKQFQRKFKVVRNLIFYLIIIMARTKKTARRSTNPNAVGSNILSTKVTELPEEAQSNILNRLSLGDRGRLSVAIKGYNDLERIHRARYRSAARQISRNLKYIPFQVKHDYYLSSAVSDFYPSRVEYLKGLNPDVPRGQPGRMRENEYRRQLEDTQPLIQQTAGGYLPADSVYNRVVQLKEPTNPYSTSEQNQLEDRRFSNERLHNVFGNQMYARNIVLV
eukprot:SAG31_NODE_10250_length_1164_cov_2.229108_1_plen_220_part_00